jgi:CheY-like chemotaxis protein
VKILIVDDEPEIRRILSVAVRDLGQAEEAANGYEAIGRFVCATSSGFPFDIVFIDVSMPGINGIAAARHMRDMDKNGVTIFMVSGVEVGLKLSQADGIDGYFIKPVSISLLRSVCSDKAGRIKS